MTANHLKCQLYKSIFARYKSKYVNSIASALRYTYFYIGFASGIYNQQNFLVDVRGCNTILMMQ